MADDKTSDDRASPSTRARLLGTLRAAWRRLVARRGDEPAPAAPRPEAPDADTARPPPGESFAAAHIPHAPAALGEPPEEPATATRSREPLTPPTGPVPMSEPVQPVEQLPPAPQTAPPAAAGPGTMLPASTSLVPAHAVPLPAVTAQPPQPEQSAEPHASRPTWTPSRRARNSFELALHLAQRPGFCCCCLCLGPYDTRRARRIFALVRAIKRAERGEPPPRRWLRFARFTRTHRSGG